MCPPFSYCNAGDPYITTLLRDHDAGQWIISDYAAVLEEYERENELADYETFDECPDRCPSCNRASFTLKHFPGSGRGDTYSWICDSCNHHCFAIEGYEPGEWEKVECRANSCTIPHLGNADVACAHCGKSVVERDSWGDGDIGDGDIPSFCSQYCYGEGSTPEHWSEPGADGVEDDSDESDEGGDVPGTGDEP